MLFSLRVKMHPTLPKENKTVNNCVLLDSRELSNLVSYKFVANSQMNSHQFFY